MLSNELRRSKILEPNGIEVKPYNEAVDCSPITKVSVKEQTG